MNNNVLKIGLASCASFVAGYFVANWRNETFYFDRANEEVEAAREEIRAEFVDELDAAQELYEETADRLKNMGLLSQFTDKLDNAQVDGEIQQASLVMMEVEAEQALKTYQGEGGFEPVDIHALAPVAPVIQYSDYMTPEKSEDEKKETGDKKPTVEVLTAEEYMNDPVDYEESTLIYYAGDDTLVGGRVGEGVVGETLRAQMLVDKDVLKRPEFWEKSDDIWYFRNHALKYNFEIIREEGNHPVEESSGVDG